MSLINEVKRVVREERWSFSWGLFFILCFIIISFYNSLLQGLLLFWFVLVVFYIPGYLIGMYMGVDEKLSRSAMGVGCAMAYFGIGSYLLGLIGVHVQFHAVITTVVIYLFIWGIILVRFWRGKKVGSVGEKLENTTE